MVQSQEIAETVEVATDDAGRASGDQHQWGAITLFHGLPSNRVRALAQTPDGALWFGTDAGLARFDGRRTQTVNIPPCEADGGNADAHVATNRHSILSLHTDKRGALWIGTTAGAWRWSKGSGESNNPLDRERGEWRCVAATRDQPITAIASRDGRVVLATRGALYDLKRTDDGRWHAQKIDDSPLLRLTAKPDGGAETRLEITSLAWRGETLLVGTRGRGLLTVDPNGAWREQPMKPRPFFIETILSGERDEGDGRLWLGAQAGTSESGLYAVTTNQTDDTSEQQSVNISNRTALNASSARTDANETTWRLTEIQNMRAGGVSAVAATASTSGNATEIWAGSGGERGVFKVDARGALVARWSFQSTGGGLTSDQINSALVDREGVVWFGTERGACRFDERAVRRETLRANSSDANSLDSSENNFVRALYRASDGTVWCGTQRGLFFRDSSSNSSNGGATWRAVEELKDRTVHTIAEDARGRLIVGTPSGLLLAQTNNGALDAQRFTPVVAAEDARTAGSVRASIVFRDETYVAAFGRGVMRIEPGSDRLINLTATIENDNNDDARAALREPVSLHVVGSQTLLIGTTRGAFSFDGAHVSRLRTTDQAIDAQLKDATVWDIASDQREQIWLATTKGLFNLQPDRRARIALAGEDVRAVRVVSDTDGRETDEQIWCATNGGGLATVRVVAATGELISSRIDVEQGMPSQNVFALLSLDAADRDRIGENTATNANAEQITSAQQMKTSSEPTLLIGTGRGLARYTPGKVAPLLAWSRIGAEPVSVVGEAAQPSEDLRAAIDRQAGDTSHSSTSNNASVTLEYPRRELSVEVAATSSRTFPENFQYRFALRDGRGKVLRETASGASSFNFAALEPGAYRLEAEAYGVDLRASAPIALDITVEAAPPPLATIALSVLLAGALGGLALGWWQNRRIKSAGAQLASVNRELLAARTALANEAEAERRRIARDLHDQTLADLRRLMLRSDQLAAPDKIASGKDETSVETESGEQLIAAPHDGIDRNRMSDARLLRSEIEAISDEVRRICEDLSPSVLENVGFTAALRYALTEALTGVVADEKLTGEFACAADDLDERLNLSTPVQIQIYRIVQEALSNVCRHADAGRLLLEVSLADDELLIALTDDGLHFAPDTHQHNTGRGLIGMTARASLINAALAWSPRGGDAARGTRWTLRVPTSAKV